MRRYSRLAAVALVVAFGACSDSDPPTVPEKSTALPQLTPPAVSNPYCSPITAEDITAELHDLFVKNAWPDEASTKGKFQGVQDALAAGDVDGARIKTRDLIRFIDTKFGNLTPTEKAASQAIYDDLITDLWCYVGISGQVFDLNPGDPEKAFDIPGVGGVLFPADIVDVGTIVSLTDISDQPNPATTDLDTYPGYLSIDLYPYQVLPQPATVVLCPSANAPSDVVVGHQDPFIGFELLEPTAVPLALQGTCATSSSLNRGPIGWLERLLAQAGNAFLPQPLQASAMMFAGGIGALTIKFSPFLVVSPTLSATGGLGSTATKFAPPATPNAPALNPPLPSDYIQGTAGSSTTTGLPSVTVQTLGGDEDGVNPIANVTITFKVEPTQTFTPNSNATVCTLDGNGNPVAAQEVQVTTNAQGVATLPCLSFGTSAGYANLSATFDATTLGFPFDELVTVTANLGTSNPTGSSLNWLVVTNPGAASLIKTYFPPAAPQENHDYGSNLTPYTDVSPDPQVLVTDAFGNAVGSQTVYWSANTSNGSSLTVGSGGTTGALGVAAVDSWNIGEGLNQLVASLYDANATPPAGFVPATFTASTPTGVSVFACALPGTSKTDLAPFSIKTPNGSVRSVTLSMSVTGTAASVSAYPATLKVYTGAFRGTQIGQGSGTVALPGDNGNPVAQTFVLSDPALKTEYASGPAGQTLWFELTVTTPATRKVQLWYKSGSFRSNDPCFSSLVYTPSYPTSPSFKRGLAINATN